MKFKYTVTVVVKKVSGPPAEQEEISDAIFQGIQDGANDAEISGLDDNADSEYEVTRVEVEEVS